MVCLVQAPPTTETEMFLIMFDYIDRLFGIVRPRRLLYMAIGKPSISLAAQLLPADHVLPVSCVTADNQLSRFSTCPSLSCVCRWCGTTCKDEPATVTALSSCSGRH